MTPLRIIVLHGATGTTPDEVDTALTAEAIRDALSRQGHAAQLVHLSDRSSFPPWRSAQSPDLVFNMVEAIDGDMARAAEVPQMLEDLGQAFTGCGSEAHLATRTKTVQKRLMRDHRLPTPDWSETGLEMDHLDRVIVKSDSEHASIGMDAGSVVPGAQAVEEIANRQARFGGTFFAEAYIPGREFNLSLLATGNGVKVLPPAEILFEDFPEDAPQIVDYAAKWDEGSHAYTHTPRRFAFPPEDDDLLSRLEALAREAWRVFDLSGYARVDFRVDPEGGIWILEVNTNPCLAPDAGFVAAAERAGLTFDTLIARIAATAMAA